MKNRIIVLLIAVSVSAAAFAGDGKVHKTKEFVPNEYIVTFAGSVSGHHEVAKELVRIHGGTLLVSWQTFKAFGFRGSEAAAEAISRDPRVELVEVNGVAYVQQVAPVDPPGWALDRINQRLPPLDGSALFSGNRGLGTMLYVVDTGINNVPSEFGTRLRNLWTFNTSFADETDHGTSVASAAAGATVGVAREAEIVNVKACGGSTGSCSTLNVASAIDQINMDFLNANPNEGYWKPAVVNMSFRVTGIQSGLEGKIRESIRLGIAYVVAAGNATWDGANWVQADPTNITPARMGKPNVPSVNPYPEHTTTVGATSFLSPWTRDYVADIPGVSGYASNIGPPIDIWAPGYQVKVINRNGQAVPRNGTSFATPYVSGAMLRYAQSDIGNGSLRGATRVDYWERSLVNFATWNQIINPDTGDGNLLGANNAFLYLYGGTP